MNRYIKKHELKFLSYPKSKPRKMGFYFVISTSELRPQHPITDIAMWHGKDGWKVSGFGEEITVHAWARLPETKEWKELLQLEE